MPKKDEEHRKRVVVEEIKEPQETKVSEEPETPASVEEPAVEEIKQETEEEKNAPETEKPKEEGKVRGPEHVAKEEKKKEKPEFPKEVEEKKSLWYIFWIMIPVAIIVGVLAGGVFYFLNSVNKNSATPTPTPFISSSPTPSASPSAQTDLTKYPVKVLNGSGIAGEAGKVQDILTAAGFKVSSAGNAPTYNYTNTVIQTSDKVTPDFVSKLTGALAKTYAVSSKTSAIPSGETSDVVVIVGSSKATQ